MTTLAAPPAPTTVAAAQARELSKVYGSGSTAVRALDRVSVQFELGRFTAIMGPSGSGKSSLMHCMAGLDSISEGQAMIGDTDLTRLSDKALTLLRRNHIGFVFQSFNLLPMLTALQNITLPTKLSGRRVDREHLDQIVATLGLADRLAHRPSELSGGQQQRVAIARALLSRPEVIFADEPTGSLDSVSSGELLSFLRRSVRELSQTVVMVTHDPVAASYADRVVLLADGHVVGEILDPTTESVLAVLSDLGA